MTTGRITSYAQNFEDVLLWRALGGLQSGFYVDIGAQHPVDDSVSFGFYEQGWRGIHVEPTPHYADLLRHSRSDEIVIQAAVNDKPGQLSFYEVSNSGVSTLFWHIAEEWERRGWAVKKTIVPTITLDQVFEAVPHGHDVHWLKIDAEGAETPILSGWRSSKVRPWVILLEAVDPFDQTPNHAPWETLILTKGYRFAYFDGLNRFYIADEHEALAEHFKFGPSVWDQFQLPQSSRLLSSSFQQGDALCRAFEAEVRLLRHQLSQQPAELSRLRELGGLRELGRLRKVVEQACALLIQMAAGIQAGAPDDAAPGSLAVATIFPASDVCNGHEAHLGRAVNGKVAHRWAKSSSRPFWSGLKWKGSSEPCDVVAGIAAVRNEAQRVAHLAEVQGTVLDGLRSTLAPALALLQGAVNSSQMTASPNNVIRLDDSLGAARIGLALQAAYVRLAPHVRRADVTVVIAEPTADVPPTSRPAILVGQDLDETGYPPDWSERINAEFRGVGCTSRHTRKILVDHGVHVPIEVVGLGVDDWKQLQRMPVPDLGSQSFRFVHVARHFNEDGTDLALRAYGRTFRGDSNVSLVIACLPGDEAEVRAEIEALRKHYDPLCPHVLVLPGSWDDAQLASLFSQCDALLAPGRAIQFSSPVALAVLSRLPVVATRWGGHLDYCSDRSAWLVDYAFEQAFSHRKLMPSVWAHALDAPLDDALRAARSAPQEERVKRAELGRQVLDESFTWDAVAGRIANLSWHVAAHEKARQTRVGWVTTWNVRCGIASAAAELASNLPPENVVIYAPRQEPRLRQDAANCHRLWQVGKGHNGLTAVLDHLDRSPVDALIIHFNYGFYNHGELDRFICDVVDRGIVVIMDLHSTIDPSPDPNMQLSGFLNALRKCNRLLAHAQADMNRLRALGLVDNVVLFPLGVMQSNRKSSCQKSPGSQALLASFGFCLPGKGLPELIEALSILRQQGRDARLLMLNAQYPSPVSDQEVARIKAAIDHFGLREHVDFRTDYLTEDKCLDLLQQAHLIVNPYQTTGEAASASARLALASRTPLVVTSIPIFDDLADAVFRTSGTSPLVIADGIANALHHIEQDTPEARAIRSAAQHWLDAHDYSRQATTLMGMIAALRHNLETSIRRRVDGV